MTINVSVASANTLDNTADNAIFDITFTNTEAFSYAENSNVYYYAYLTDSTEGTPLTREVIFEINHPTSGTVDANTPQTFTFENTTDLVPTINPSNGRIFYVAQ